MGLVLTFDQTSFQSNAIINLLIKRKKNPIINPYSYPNLIINPETTSKLAFVSQDYFFY